MSIVRGIVCTMFYIFFKHRYKNRIVKNWSNIDKKTASLSKKCDVLNDV